MSLFQVLIVVLLFLIFMTLCFIGIIFSMNMKKKAQKEAILSHRELWLYYMNDKDLTGLLGNNNGKVVDLQPENLTEKQYRFLVLFLNHMETMLPSWKKYEKDWIGLFKNQNLRFVYEKTKLYRDKRFCKLIDSIIESYDKKD